MSLVAIACPQTESELACMQCELEAHGIRVFVQGAGFGSLWPGVQILAYNARRVMVSTADLPRASAVLAPYTRPAGPPSPYQWPGLFHVVRMVVEVVVLYWCVPVGWHRRRDHI